MILLRTSRLTMALGSLLVLTRAAMASTVPMRVEVTTNLAYLVVSPVTNLGALFVLGAPELPALATGPCVVFQTNTPQAAGLRVPIPVAGAFSNRAFFVAAHWPGQAPALVSIPAGSFVMGSPPTEVGRFAWEGPQTLVTLTNTFLMGKCEVTQGEYKALMTVNPSYFSGVSNRPVEQVSWDDAQEYCRRLTTGQRQAGCLPPGWVYRLPTDAEWEYACRAGTTTPFSVGPDLVSGVANFDGYYEYYGGIGEVYNPNGVHLWKTAAVGGYAPNPWGLCDMHGNVWEWCQDWWSAALPGGSVTNPIGPAAGTEHVFRGGCWYNDGRFCRSAYRLHGLSANRSNDLGFRVVLAPN
jgi:formylglycine-generating enzyme required for sulfatase activity